MKTLRISILFALFSSALFAQDVAPPVSLGGPAGVTGGLSLEGQNILTHMTDANYTMIAGGWWAATQIIPSTLTQTSAHTITAPANGGQPYFFCNFSGGGFTDTITAGSGGTVPVPNGSCVGMHYVTGQGYIANSTGGSSPGGASYSLQYNVPGGTPTLGGATISGAVCGGGTTAAPSACSSTQIQTAIGASVYDAYNAAATALTSAETFSANATNITSGTVPLARLPGSGQIELNSVTCALGASCLLTSTAQHISGSEIFLNMLPQFISGTTVTDSSGNGNNATLCTGGNAPTSTLTGLLFSDNSRCANLPSSVNNIRTAEFVINIPSYGSSGSGAQAALMTPSTSGATNNGPWVWLSAWISAVGGNNWTSTPGLSLWKYGADTTTTPVNLSSGNHVIVVTFGTTGTDYDHFYFDGVEVTPYTNQGYSAGTQLSGNWILGSCQSCGVNSAAIVTEYEFIGWSTELTAAQVAQEYAASSSDMQARGAGAVGVQWNSIGPNWYAYGDSLTFCLDGTIPADCWVNQPPAPVPAFGLVKNLGNAGKTADYIMSTNAGNAAAYCSSNQGPQVATILDGTNNFYYYSTATGVNVAGLIANQVQLLTQAGCKVFVGTMINRNSTPVPPNGLTWSQNQIALDNQIRQNWKAWGAVGILDFAADPFFGCSTCSANGTYYQSDFTHLQNAGYLLMQADAWQSMEYYFGYNKSNPNYLVQTVAGSVATAGSIPGGWNNNLPANWAVVVPSPLISGPLSSITLGFNAAPTTAPITLAYATGTAPTFTIVPGSSFTVTPAATSGNQTFVAGTGFTAPLNAVGGEFPVIWGTATGPGLGGGTPLYYLTGQSSLPSGAQTYTAFSGENVGLTMTVTNPPVTTTAYQMLASDGYIELTQASAGETLTLPSCVGQSGAEYTINNQTGQTISLKNLNSTQPINGTDHSTSALTLPTGAAFKVTDVPNPLGTTSGCHWSY